MTGHPWIGIERAKLFLVALIVLAAGGCKSTGGPAATPAGGPKPAEPLPAADPGATAALAAAAATYWDARLESNPLEATALGDRRFDDRLPDNSPSGRERRMEQLRATRTAVEAVSPVALSSSDRVTRALLLGEIDAELAFGACHLEEWAVDAREGPQVSYLRLPDLQPVRTVAEGRTLIARWQKMGGTIDQQLANLQRGLAAGKTAPAAEVNRVLGQLDELLAKKNADWPLRAPAKVVHGDWPASERRAFAKAVDAAIADGIRPAFQRLRDFLRRDILPRARDESRAGIVHLPDGAACYARLVKVHTSLDLPAQEIHEIGLEELRRIHEEMGRVGQEALGTAALPEIRRRLREDASLYFKTREEIETAAREAVERAHAVESRFLGKAPRTACEIKRIDAFEEKDAPIAYYRSAAIDGTRPGQYYVNTFQPETRPQYEVEALAFHEAIPGHHTQIALAQELTGLPEFRKHVGVTAFVEGWALYAEGLADELGLYTGARDRLGRLGFDAWRAGRLVVDTGIHALGWSRSKAIAFMEENTVLASNNILNEVDRYIAWPGQALAYKIGEREIRRLRADAQQRLGPRFDLRSFHDVLLGGGGVSLPVLREQVSAWADAHATRWGGPRP